MYPDIQLNYTCLLSSRLRGATVARLTPDQKVACSNHVGVNGNLLWRGTGRQDWVACSPSVWVRSTAGDGAVLNGWPITLLQNRNSRQQRKCAAAQSARCVQPLLVPLVRAGPGSAEVRRTDTRQNVVSSNPVRGGRKH